MKPIEFRKPILLWVMVVFSIAVDLSSTTGAAEPAADFLERLRAAGYYDHAIAYLSRLDQYPGVESDLKSAVPLEIARTHIDSAINSRTARERDESFDAATESLNEFLKQTSHPRLSEARSQLGKLQMVRGAQAIAGESDAAAKAKARELFTSAAGTFDAIIADLRGKLKDLQGARADSSQDPGAAARRDQYRFDFLQAQLNAGEARFEAAKTFDRPAQQGKKQLEEALGLYTDLSEKYEDYVQGANAYYHRGMVQKILGQNAKALESFTIMLEQPDADGLRDSKIGATVGMMGLALGRKVADYDAAIKSGEPWAKSLRPNERRSPMAQELRLSLAKAYLAKRDDKAKTKVPDQKRAEADARKLLLDAKKIPGTHLAETDQLLSAMGIDSASESDVVLPTATEDPKTFAEALAGAQQILQATQDLQANLDTLVGQNAKPESIADLKSQLSETRSIGISLLRRGLPLVTRETDIRQVNEARKFLAFMLYSDDRTREAVVVGEFLSRAAPKTAEGLSGGLLALSSLQKMIAETQSETAPTIAKLEEIGQYLLDTWPDDPQAAAAQGIMIRLALSRDEFDKAAQAIDKMPDGVEKSAFRRLQGQLKFSQASKLRIDGDDDGASKLIQSAITDLKAGLDGIAGGLVAPADLQAALILAKAELQAGDPNAAVATLDHEKFGPVTLVGKVDSPSELFLPELYRTQLQALVGQMTTGTSDNDKLVQRASTAMDNLRKSADGPDGEKKLVSIFLSLATEIRQQLDESTPDQKEKLISAFRVFLSRIAASTDNVATLNWVGQTLMEMGEASMAPGEVKATGQAAEMLASAAETFAGLSGKKDVPLTNEFLLGKSLRLSGKYGEALDAFEKLLKEKPMMLDAQKEAALSYEQMAPTMRESIRGKVYAAAMSGGRPDENRKNVIWGWGRIAQLTQRGDQFRDQFFEARLHIAICRYLQGKALNNKSIIEKAAGDITSVAGLYPDLGGPERKKEFESLLKKIQTELGQPPVGLGG